MSDGALVRSNRLPRGTPVEVRAGLEPHFCSGFEVAATTSSGYRVRRRSDRTELPAVFRAEDIRRDRG